MVPLRVYLFLSKSNDGRKIEDFYCKCDGLFSLLSMDSEVKSDFRFSNQPVLLYLRFEKVGGGGGGGGGGGVCGFTSVRHSVRPSVIP